MPKVSSPASPDNPRRGRPNGNGVTDLKQMSDDELISLVRHLEVDFAKDLKEAFKQRLKVAGEALLELKRRVGHKHWGKWLKENFNRSEESARLYMRIARNWEAVKHLNSIRMMRAELAKTDLPEEDNLPEDDIAANEAESSEKEAETTRKQKRAPSNSERGKRSLPVPNTPEFEQRLEQLMADSGVSAPTDAINLALEYLCQDGRTAYRRWLIDRKGVRHAHAS